MKRQLRERWYISVSVIASVRTTRLPKNDPFASAFTSPHRFEFVNLTFDRVGT